MLGNNHEFPALSLPQLKRDREKDKRIPYFRILNWYFFCICIYFVYGKILQQHIHVVHLENPIVGLLTNHHSFKSFVCWTVGFCTFILSLEKGTYKYQFTQFGWTHVTLLMVVVSASCMINNMYDGMVSFTGPRRKQTKSKAACSNVV
jgi:phosphatidate cytidylyltransferase